MHRDISRRWKVFLVGAVLVCLAVVVDGRQGETAPSKAKPPTTEALMAEIEGLKKLLPDQAHAMADVGYHFSNLWFAGDAENWPLAEFYLNETRSHLQWAVRIKPIRQDKAKQDVDLTKILEAVENTPLKQLGESITANDKEQFVAAYRFTVESCYACHKASEKPYLRPQIPRHEKPR